MFRLTDRAQALQSLKAKEFDLVIIGGGITGAGVARDAASRGMSVALVEAGDFASGTSSRSSKLIHGGIRYLENLEFHLVFEALSERRILFEIAPHLVHPLRFVLPVYRHSRVGMFKMGLGMWLYDALSMFETPELHERLNARAAIRRLPWLQNQELLGAFAYSDAYMDDDRLVVETLRSASKMGAVGLNYVRADSAHIENSKIRSIQVTDTISNQSLAIRGRHFVNCAGPWTDRVGEKFLPKWQRRLRPTKGIHLTFLKERFPLHEAVVMALEKEDRIVFGIPRHEMVIVGTTDTDFPEDPATVHSTQQDVDYLLRVVNDYFPGAKLGVNDIVASYSGVRPLVDDGANSESKTSREHLIFTDPLGMTSVTGGKYTTYRHMAEQAVMECLHSFSFEERAKFSKSSTKIALNPLASAEMIERAQMNGERWASDYHLPQNFVARAVERHGFEAVEILNRMVRWQGAATDSESAYWMAEADFAIDQTACLNLRDFYLRRSPLFLSRRDHGFTLMKDISRVFSEKLGLHEEVLQKEKAQVVDHLRREMGWSPLAQEL